MRRSFPAALAAAFLLFLPPLVPAAAQTGRDSTSERTEARAQRERERERERAERAERIAERVRERLESRDDDDDDRDAAQGGMQGRTSIDTTVPFARGGVVDLSLISGEIRVVGWSRAEVRVSARSEGGRLRFEASPSRVSLDIEHQGGRHRGDLDATYELSVPVGTRVLMRSTSGDLAARGVKGEVEARSVSGSVEIDDAGRVTLESVSGDVQASRVNGEARADSVSGDVTYDGSVDPAGRYDFHSHSGTLRLVLPASTNATLSLQTFSGDIDSAFPLTVRPTGDAGREGRRSGRRMEFTLGSGGPRITAETFSGEIVIERAGRQ